MAWQWGHYAPGHTVRANLLIHILTVPLFEFGTVALLSSPLFGPVSALVGLVLMVGAMAAQGRGHAMEPQPPQPFRGPLDVVARIFLEQWLTFPRYVLSGDFTKAWNNSEKTTA